MKLFWRKDDTDAKKVEERKIYGDPDPWESKRNVTGSGQGIHKPKVHSESIRGDENVSDSLAVEIGNPSEPDKHGEAMEVHSWLFTDLERRRIDVRLRNISEALERQNRELDRLAETTAKDVSQPKLRIGNKASLLLLQAEERARDLGHRAVGTGDILWAMFHDDDEDSSAVRFLKGRGVTRESVYASHRYSDNAGTILKLAAQRSSELNKPVVGTEDLLWAIFQTEDHTHSRSQAVRRLEARGVNMALVWNQAELSKNAQAALKMAVDNARRRGDRIIGSEDLVEALFHEAAKDSGARNWITNQHVPPSFFESAAEGDAATAEDTEDVLRMFVVGGIAGVVETFVVQPLVFWKTMSQVSPDKLFSPSNLRPGVMYRGVFVNALSIGPISAFQYGCNGFLSLVHQQVTALAPTGAEAGAGAVTATAAAGAAEQGGARRQTASEGLAIAATTGALSSLVVTPAELLMISQQRSGQSFAQVLGDLWSGPKHRAESGASVGGGGGGGSLRSFYRGLGATCVRETGWTFGFLGLAPIIRRGLRDDSKFFNHNEVAASLAASILAGQAAALLTQPADTIKTLMQADRGIGTPRRFNSSWGAVKFLYAQPLGGGVGAFWRGIVPRSVRCIGAVFILGETQSRLSDLFDSYGFLTHR